MKRLLLFAALMSSVICYGQNDRLIVAENIEVNINETINSSNHCLVDAENQWNEVSYNFQGNANSKRFTFSTDSSAINGVYYFELLRSFDADNDNWENTGLFYNSVGNQVFTDKGDGAALVYNFDLIEGDTFMLFESFNPEESKLIVTRTDSIVLLDNTKRKRLYLRCESDLDGSLYGERVWVEGIGDLYGFRSIESSCLVDVNQTLLCFYQKGSLLFENEMEESCWVTTSTENIKQQYFEVYPNPSDGLFRFSLNEAKGIFDKISIYDLSGQLLYQENSQINVDDYELDLSHIDPRVLVIQLEGSQGNIWRTKLVKN